MPLPRRQNSASADEAWQVLVLRATQWQHLRPEKAWRPIISLSLDSSSSSSTSVANDLLLGADGQNPNLRVPALLPPETHKRSTLLLSVHYQPSGKSTGKGRKRRRLLGSTKLPLCDALEKQAGAVDRCCEVKIAPGIGAGGKKKSNGNGGVRMMSVFLRVRPPMESAGEGSETLVESRSESPFMDSTDSDATHSDADPNAGPSDTERIPVVTTPPSGLRHRKRRKVKGFFSDDESCSVSCSESDSDGPSPRTPTSTRSRTRSRSASRGKDTFFTEDVIEMEVYPDQIAPSLLPRVNTINSTISVQSRLSVASVSSRLSGAYDAVTYYRELREADHDSHVEIVLGRLIREWQYVGATLLAVAALDTTVFGFSSGTLFGMDGFALKALTVSAIASALGLALDAGLLFFYLGADAQKFQSLAQSIYPSYFYFALTSRLPLFSALISLLALAAFLLAVAFSAWPSAVLAACGISGVLVGLQYVVKAGELFGRAAGAGIRSIRGVAFIYAAREDAEGTSRSAPGEAELRAAGVTVPPRAGDAPPRPPRAPERGRSAHAVDVRETREGVWVDCRA